MKSIGSTTVTGFRELENPTLINGGASKFYKLITYKCPSSIFHLFDHWSLHMKEKDNQHVGGVLQCRLLCKCNADNKMFSVLKRWIDLWSHASSFSPMLIARWTRCWMYRPLNPAAAVPFTTKEPFLPQIRLKIWYKPWPTSGTCVNIVWSIFGHM